MVDLSVITGGALDFGASAENDWNALVQAGGGDIHDADTTRGSGAARLLY
jgi:hypothetical protein